MQVKSILSLFMLLSILSYSCSKEDDNGGTTTPPANNNNNPSASERQKALDDYKNMYLPSKYSSSFIQWNGNKTSCTEGTINKDVYPRVLNQVKYFRKICGLPYNHIVYDSPKNSKCQKLALMEDVNGPALNHYPPPSWKCYTPEGASVGLSNLTFQSLGIGNPIDLWIDDPWAGAEGVGHRRWILSARLATIAFGSTNTYSTLWAHGEFINPLPSSGIPAHHSYPPKYIPAPLVFNRWSFSIPHTNIESGVDFSSATVTMTDNANKAVPLTILSATAKNMGDMTISWVPQGIVKTSATDVVYKVKIDNVKVGGVTKNYDYTVTIFKP